MTRLSLLLVALTTLSVGCKQPQQPAAQPPASASTSPSEPTTKTAVVLPADTVPENASILLRRQGGAGATLYTVLVHADGRVEYQGRNLVDTKEARQGTMSPEVFSGLWLALAHTHNDDREAYEACDRVALDGPTAFTLEVFGGSATAHFFGDMDAPCGDNPAFAEVLGALTRLQSEAAVVEWVGEGNL